MNEKVKGPWKQVVVMPGDNVEDALNELEKTHTVMSVIWDGDLYHIFGKEKQTWKPSRTAPTGGGRHHRKESIG